MEISLQVLILETVGVKVFYALDVESLIYVMTSTGSSICHTVGLINKYQSNSGKEHW